MNLSNFTNEVEQNWDKYGTGCNLQSVVTACIPIEVRPDMDAVPPDTPHELVHVILGVQHFLCQFGTRRTSRCAICRSLVGVYIIILHRTVNLCARPEEMFDLEKIYNGNSMAFCFCSLSLSKKSANWGCKCAGLKNQEIDPAFLKSWECWLPFKRMPCKVVIKVLMFLLEEFGFYFQHVILMLWNRIFFFVNLCFLDTLFLAPVSSKYYVEATRQCSASAGRATSEEEHPKLVADEQNGYKILQRSMLIHFFVS